MSQPCTISTCKRVSRALCHCCKENLCLQHLNEHNMSLLAQLNPLTDEINALGDRLNALNIPNTIVGCRQKLDTWRLDCHVKIDQFFAQKFQELDHLITEKVDTQRKKTLDIQSRVAELLREQEATRHDIDSLTICIRHLAKELDVIEQTRFRINTRPIVMDDYLIQIKNASEREFDLSTFPSICKTINRPAASCKVFATNGRFLIMQQGNQLCLIDREMTIVKQSLDFQDKISDMCWSSILTRFIVVAKNGIYFVNENKVAIETRQLIEQRPWSSCTCSDTFLFLSTLEPESSIIKFRMTPSIAAIKEWKSPSVCAKGERIDHIVHNNGTLGVVISNLSEKNMRMELRSSDTYDHIWTLPLDLICSDSISTRCCSLNCDEWLITDVNAKCLVQVTNNGKIKMKIPYNMSLYSVCLFGPSLLAVSTENAVNFHNILCEY